jgi:hypothetical protein
LDFFQPWQKREIDYFTASKVFKIPEVDILSFATPCFFLEIYFEAPTEKNLLLRLK